MHSILRPLVSLWIALNCGCATSGAAVDFTGIDPFWSVVETLRRDAEPTKDQWDALFATPGYAVLKRHDRADRTLGQILPLAFSPSRSQECAEIVQSGDWRTFFIEHFRSAWDQREQLESLRQELADRDLVGDAMRDVQEWLPPGTLEHASPPKLSFVVSEPDARGYERIVVDLVLALDYGEELGMLIAHESHHVYRNQITSVRKPEGPFPERDLLASLDNLQAEGIADQIDKKDYLQRTRWGKGPTARQSERIHGIYKRAHANATETLAAMDRLLGEYESDPGTAAKTGRKLRSSLVLGGHPVGFYMATTVIEAFGRQRIIAHVADPFAFVADYSAAAAKLGSPHHVFSDKALAGVERLARRFRGEAR